MRVTDSRRGRAATGGRGIGGSIGRCAPGSIRPRCKSSHEESGAKASPTPAPCSTVSRRSSQRDGTVGVPSVFSARVSTTSRAAASWQKSCAARPIRRSGSGRPNASCIGRLIQGSGAGSPGHTPSLSPPSTIRSACWRRASSGPQMLRRGCRPKRGRTAWPAISASSMSG